MSIYRELFMTLFNTYFAIMLSRQLDLIVHLVGISNTNSPLLPFLHLSKNAQKHIFNTATRELGLDYKLQAS